MHEKACQPIPVITIILSYYCPVNMLMTMI